MIEWFVDYPGHAFKFNVQQISQDNIFFDFVELKIGSLKIVWHLLRSILVVNVMVTLDVIVTSV